MTGLASVRPQLRVLRMTGPGVRLQGTGICPGASAASGGCPGLPLLRDLQLNGSWLLCGRVRDLSVLRHLRRLSLTDITRKVRPKSLTDPPHPSGVSYMSSSDLPYALML